MRTFLGSSLFLSLAAAAPLGAQCSSTEVFSIQASDDQPGSFFGWTVDADNDWLVSGAHKLNSEDGAAYVHKLDGSLQEFKLQPPVAGGAGEFGYSLALSGSWLVVGEPEFGDDGRGRIHVYTLVGGAWTFAQSFEGVGFEEHLGFDVDVDAEAGVLVAGSQAGVVQIFGLDAGVWSSLRRLKPLLSGEGFGWSVFLEGWRLAVGAPIAGGGAGAVYHYEGSGVLWDLIQRIPSPSPDPGSAFGIDVVVQGDTLLAGASYEDVGGLFNVGGVYAFDFDGAAWNQVAHLTPPDPEELGYAAGWIAMKDDIVLMGGPSLTNPLGRKGKVMQYRRQGASWVYQQELYASQDANSVLGAGLAINDHRVYAGARGLGQTLGFDLDALSLCVDPPAPSVGEWLFVHSTGGAPGQLVALTLATLNGAPWFTILVKGSFDAEGRQVLPYHYTNPALTGLQLELQTLGIDAGGKVRASNLAPLDFQ